jgi:hypothetical protein
MDQNIDMELGTFTNLKAFYGSSVIEAVRIHVQSPPSARRGQPAKNMKVAKITEKFTQATVLHIILRINAGFEPLVSECLPVRCSTASSKRSGIKTVIFALLHR